MNNLQYMLEILGIDVNSSILNLFKEDIDTLIDNHSIAVDHIQSHRDYMKEEEIDYIEESLTLKLFDDISKYIIHSLSITNRLECTKDSFIESVDLSNNYIKELSQLPLNLN